MYHTSIIYERKRYNERKFKTRKYLRIENAGDYGRNDSRGRLAHTPHPFPENDKNIGRDFCENQIEFISDVFTDSGENLDEIIKDYAKINRVG